MTRQKRLDAYETLIRQRGGETVLQGKYGNTWLEVRDEHRNRGLVLFQCEGWRQYSRRFGARRASLAYLAGRDDNGMWAVRVPGNTTSVAAALARITPAKVRKAKEGRLRVLRQGDVYLIERNRDDMRALTGTRHRWNPETRTITHTDPANPHAALYVPWPAEAVLQRVLRMGRLGSFRRTRHGD